MRERSNDANKFTATELRAKVRESREFWASPAGKAEQRRLDAAREKRGRGVKFPELAQRAGTRPAINEVADWNARLGLR